MEKTRSLASEFSTLDLGDVRLDRRAARTLDALARQPSAHVTKSLSLAELEGYYRFVNNEKVTFEALLSGHIDSTKARARGLDVVIVAEDSTDFRFRDEVAREGLGPMDNGGQGFYAHFALAIAADGIPLGVLGVETWTRQQRAAGQPKPSQRERYLAEDKESLRWTRMVDAIEREMAWGPMVVHVEDREADDFDHLADMVAKGRHFVIRASTDRRLLGEDPIPPKLKQFVAELEVVCERTAKLSSRPKKGRPAKEIKKYPARRKRLARLSFAADRVHLRRPDKASKSLPESLELNVVFVNELFPPEGCEPVQWMLYTSEPVDTAEQIVQVVDYYRLRWCIEEFFKALKTGCSFEARQHESLTALLNALGIFIPIAWSLLNLRVLARSPKFCNAPANTVLTKTQLEIIHAKSGGKTPRNPSIREAMLAIAKYFGGHQKSNGEPGWQVLGRGYEELLMGEIIWNLAMAASTS